MKRKDKRLPLTETVIIFNSDKDNLSQMRQIKLVECQRGNLNCFFTLKGTCTTSTPVLVISGSPPQGAMVA